MRGPDDNNPMACYLLGLGLLSVARALCVGSLPSLNATRSTGPSGPVQIIVPYYRFTCPATLVSMTVKVSGNESGNGALYAQIWRPTADSPGNDYTVVWAGSYPDSDVFVNQPNNRSGDDVVFRAKIGAGFPLFANDVVGLRVVGQGVQVAYTTSPGGMNTQAVQDPYPCNLSLCNTLTIQGVAPILTVNTSNDTIDAIRTAYPRQYKFCNASLIMSCPSTSVLGPQTTPTPVTPMTTPTPVTPMTTPTYQLLTSFPISIAASIPSVLFVLVVAASLVSMVVLCVKRKRGITKRVECVGRSSEGHDMEGERIETVACEAYTSTISTNFGRGVVPYKITTIPVPSEGHDMEGGRIETVPCEAYASTTSTDYKITIIPVPSDMEGEKMEMVSCEAYASIPSLHFRVQPPVPDDHAGHYQMGAVTEDDSEYI